MWQLIAEGPQPQQRRNLALNGDRPYLLGRNADCDLSIPWEPVLSRQHAHVRLRDGQVEVIQSEGARNPIFVEGVQRETFLLRSGQRFVVGGTQFLIREIQPLSPSPHVPVQQLSFSDLDLEQVQFEDADHRLEALARLPHVIGRTPWKDEAGSHLVALILAGIRHAEAVAVVVRDPQGDVQVTAWSRRIETAGTFRPSSSLVNEALHERRSILHVWENESEQQSQYTVSSEFDWAFCTPVSRGEMGSWGIYVAGRMDVPWGEGEPPAEPGSSQEPGSRLSDRSRRMLRQNMQSDVRFAQLVGAIVNSADRMNRMEGQLSVLRQFLSPPILKALEETGVENELNIDLLNPKVCDVTVLFCDLRGFSHRAEEAADDLPGLLSRVNAALEVMTKEILDHGGVTGDFLGDAVLGFWGWPFASEEAPLRACRAALSIRRAFAEIQSMPDHPLADFQMGIGIAHGRAVAGKIGTSGRMSVTVFGPVVNLASRLEGMTKRLQVPILLDEATANLARGLPARASRDGADSESASIGSEGSESPRRGGLSSEEGRVRRLATVLPYGMETPLTVSELVPPQGPLCPLTDRDLEIHEEAVEHFRAGRWQEAYDAFHKLPSSDRAQDFLLALITQQGRSAPPGWRGIVELPGK
jgi:adenylate cyclase